jgi:hypothetical protein
MLSPFITVYKSLEINKQFFFKLPFCAISLKKRKRKSEENGKAKGNCNGKSGRPKGTV